MAYSAHRLVRHRTAVHEQFSGCPLLAVTSGEFICRFIALHPKLNSFLLKVSYGNALANGLAKPWRVLGNTLPPQGPYPTDTTHSIWSRSIWYCDWWLISAELTDGFTPHKTPAPREQVSRPAPRHGPGVPSGQLRRDRVEGQDPTPTTSRI